MELQNDFFSGVANRKGRESEKVVIFIDGYDRDKLPFKLINYMMYYTQLFSIPETNSLYRKQQRSN